MKARLYFKDVEGDAVPYLWNDKTGRNPADDTDSLVASVHDFELARDWCSNRCRAITIVEGRQAALAQAHIAQDEHNGKSIITHLGHDTWAVGTLQRDGEYDSGLPTITDARSHGFPVQLELDVDILDEIDFRILERDHDLDVMQIDPATDLHPTF